MDTLTKTLLDSIEMFQPGQAGATMTALVHDFTEGRIDRSTYDTEWARLHCETILRAGPVLIEIPPGGLLYGRWKAQTEAALERGEPSGWAAHEQAEAVRERPAFKEWLAPITDRFDAMAGILSTLTNPPSPDDAPNLQALLRDGNQMHQFYMARVRDERIPYLPKHLGRYGSVLRAWEFLRDRVSPRLTGFVLDGAE